MWILRILAWLAFLIFWVMKFWAPADKIAFIWWAWNDILPFLGIKARFWIATVWEILVWLILISWCKKFLKAWALIWAIIMLVALNATWWSEPKAWILLAICLATVFCGWWCFCLCPAPCCKWWDCKDGSCSTEKCWSGKTDKCCGWSCSTENKDMTSWMASGIGWAVAGAKNIVEDVAWKAWDMVEWVADKAKDMVEDAADKVDAATGGVASSIIDKVEDIAEDAIDAVKEQAAEMMEGEEKQEK